MVHMSYNHYILNSLKEHGMDAGIPKALYGIPGFRV